MTSDKNFFRCLYWTVILLVMILALAIFTDIQAKDMKIYLQAMRINNGS